MLYILYIYCMLFVITFDKNMSFSSCKISHLSSWGKWM